MESVGVAVTVVSVTSYAAVPVYAVVPEAKAGSKTTSLSVRLLKVASVLC